MSRKNTSIFDEILDSISEDENLQGKMDSFAEKKRPSRVEKARMVSEKLMEIAAQENTVPFAQSDISNNTHPAITRPDAASPQASAASDPDHPLQQNMRLASSLNDAHQPPRPGKIVLDDVSRTSAAMKDVSENQKDPARMVTDKPVCSHEGSAAQEELSVASFAPAAHLSLEQAHEIEQWALAMEDHSPNARSSLDRPSCLVSDKAGMEDCADPESDRVSGFASSYKHASFSSGPASSFDPSAPCTQPSGFADGTSSFAHAAGKQSSQQPVRSAKNHRGGLFCRETDFPSLQRVYYDEDGQEISEHEAADAPMQAAGDRSEVPLDSQPASVSFASDLNWNQTEHTQDSAVHPAEQSLGHPDFYSADCADQAEYGHAASLNKDSHLPSAMQDLMDPFDPRMSVQAERSAGRRIWNVCRTLIAIAVIGAAGYFGVQAINWSSPEQAAWRQFKDEVQTYANGFSRLSDEGKEGILDMQETFASLDPEKQQEVNDILAAGSGQNFDQLVQTVMTNRKKADLESQLAAANDAISQVDLQQSSTASALQEAQGLLKEAERGRSDAGRELENAQAQLDKVNSQIETARKTIEQNTAEIAELQEEIARMEEDTDLFKNIYIRMRQSSLNSKQSQLENAQQTLVARQAELEACQLEAAQKQQTYDEQNAVYTEIEAQVSSLQQQWNAQEQSRKDNEALADSLQQQLDELGN